MLLVRGEHRPRFAARFRARANLADALLAGAGTGTREHSRQVAELAGAIAERLGLARADREHVRAVARLHDIGKVKIPASTINKPGPLSDLEWKLIRLHTIAGERLASELGEAPPVPRFVRHSHERWDGGGYPDGLSGEQIPIASRIVFCADAFDAIRSDRPYRPGRSPAEALAEVQRGAGSQFDPAVVGALCEVVRPQLHAAPHEGRRRRAALAVALSTVSIGTAALGLIVVSGSRSTGLDEPASRGAGLSGTAAGTVSVPSSQGQGAVAGEVGRGTGAKVKAGGVKKKAGPGPSARSRRNAGSRRP